MLVEAGLLGLALAAATGRLVRPARRLARGLAALGLIFGLGTLAGMLLELATAPLPFVRSEAPTVGADRPPDGPPLGAQPGATMVLQRPTVRSHGTKKLAAEPAAEHRHQARCVAAQDQLHGWKVAPRPIARPERPARRSVPPPRRAGT